MTYSYTFEIGEAEQIRGCRIVANRRRSMRVMYLLFGVCFLVVAGLYARDRWRGEVRSEFLFVVVTGGLVGGLAAAYMGPRSTVRSLRKKNRAATGPQTCMLDDRGLHVSALGVNTSIEWANIVEVVETKEFLLFYVSAAWAALLPKRVVPIADAVPLRSALVLWAGEKAHLRPAA